MPDEAFARAFDLYRERLSRVARARLGKALRARLDEADIVQEVYLKAARRLREYLATPSVTLYGWLLGLTREKVIQAHRYHGRHKRDVKREDRKCDRQQDDSGSDRIPGHLIDPVLTPYTAAQHGELEELLNQAIELLEPQDREVLALRHFELCSNAEAASILGIKEDALRQRHLRALRRLRRLLDGIPELQGLLS